MRADARYNLACILAAAEAEILEHGPDVSMTTIAEKAPVEAVVVAFSARIVDRAEHAAESIVAAGDAMVQIEKLLGDFVADAATNPGLKSAATALGAAIITPGREERGLVALRRLVSAAQRDGDLRELVRAEDVFLLMVVAPTTHPEPVRERWLYLTFAGLRTTC